MRILLLNCFSDPSKHRPFEDAVIAQIKSLKIDITWGYELIKFSKTDSKLSMHLIINICIISFETCLRLNLDEYLYDPSGEHIKVKAAKKFDCVDIGNLII